MKLVDDISGAPSKKAHYQNFSDQGYAILFRESGRKTFGNSKT